MNEMRFETAVSGERIPCLGLGTWGMGGGNTPEYSRDDETVQVIRYAIELGFTHIDTAEGYADGHSEELVGQALKGMERGQVFLTTKVSPSHLHYREVLTSLEGSLRRLEVDYIDLYLIHWPNSDIPLSETFRALNELVEQKRVHHLGVSNFDLHQLKEAQNRSNTPLLTNQVPYSLGEREYVRNGVLEYCQEQGILLTAYSPVKRGEIRNPVVRKIGQKYGATQAQVALAWLIRQPKVITIPKSANRAHLEENLGALELQLADEDVEQLDRLKR